MFAALIKTTRTRLAKRRQFNALVEEVNGLSDRDLADINGSRSEMIYQIRKQVYGA